MNLPYLKQQLTRQEKYMRDLYDDADGKLFREKRTANGKLSIGVGHNIEDKGLRPDEIELILTNDINDAIKDLNDHIAWCNSLDEPRYLVLVNMVFNMGISRLLGFHNMLTALQSGDYQKAADEMVNSDWYKQTGVRALELVNQMRTGELL